ncbi:MAG: hypothetical protein CMJ24_08870 [Phycisphaerae bacterium]|nr:hypothetical protein [Phycisphaerae bacterium]|tara:strand:+ start:5018 stop:5620 length:603 start_codon:yes stop_codon:yes gene_type:complete
MNVDHHPSRAMVGQFGVVLLRVSLLAVLSFFAFAGYALSRTYDVDELGLRSPWIAVRAGAVSLVLMMLVCWTAMVWHLPDVIRVSRYSRRWRNGCCSSCGYPAGDGTGPCNECGAPFVEPARLQLTVSMVLRSLVVIFVCWLIGVAVGEGSVRLDERNAMRQFASERLVNPGVDSIKWTRAWPGHGTIVVADDGSVDAGE